jgi:hypothetical protein
MPDKNKFNIKKIGNDNIFIEIKNSRVRLLILLDLIILINLII